MGKSLPIAPVEHPWATIVVLLAAAVVFGAIPLSLAWLWARLFSPAKPGIQKNATYECGLEAKGDAWIQLNVSYYLYAIVF
jgi:NADH:ubiquinone oxidoreductase subunit 3 (subunit A)